MVYKFIKRSKGVVIFAVSLIAYGSFSAFLLILSLALIPLNNDVAQMRAMMPSGTLSMSLFWVSSTLNLLIFISWVITGIGALHLKEWARQCLRVVMSIYVINMLINIFLNYSLAEEMLAKIPMGFFVGGIMIAFSYYLGVIYFFSHPDIVRQFKFKSQEY